MLEDLLIRSAKPSDDGLIADFFYLMWQDYELDTMLSENWREETLFFIKDARERLEYAAFIAEHKGQAVGCAACQVFNGPYPFVFQSDKVKYGYIWGVYVRGEFRDKGIASQLTLACNEYLKSIGCTKVLLHASPMGKSVYEKLGFEASNEMRIDLL